MTGKSTHSAAAQAQPAVDDSGILVEPGPYSMGATCELSEDRFLTNEVPIVAGDRIMPFSVVDPFTHTVTVEALVLSSSGSLKPPVPRRGRHLGLVVHGAEDALRFYLRRRRHRRRIRRAADGHRAALAAPPPGATTAAAWLTRTGPATGRWTRLARCPSGRGAVRGRVAGGAVLVRVGRLPGRDDRPVRPAAVRRP